MPVIEFRIVDLHDDKINVSYSAVDDSGAGCSVYPGDDDSASQGQILASRIVELIEELTHSRTPRDRSKMS